MLKSSGTYRIPGILLAIVSISVFATAGIINYQYGIALLLGMTVGGYIGAHISVKVGNKWLKNIFLIAILIAALKILFF